MDISLLCERLRFKLGGVRCLFRGSGRRKRGRQARPGLILRGICLPLLGPCEKGSSPEPASELRRVLCRFLCPSRKMLASSF